MGTLDPRASKPDARLSSPAVARNREPILEVLRQHLPSRGLVLEIASGSGEHALHFATALPDLDWQPSDPSPQARASIAAWRDRLGPANLHPPLALDVTRRPWPVEDFTALVCINMLHISPWAATEALLAEAGERLPVHGVLYLYGPFKRDGVHTAPSNAEFDRELRARNPRWGIRDLTEVTDLATRHGLHLEAVVDMPANNLSVVLRRHG
ncbi:SAM-dependent methyltransferase [Litchfieldella qijiaojingensis]|uniref:SAM-dependent methyltransferase n=1 Tax=Litchfieldella qijiaojingensis TaxID=980347 RepID=A0ABQ2ZE08_9GAMM|nr:DUF938 domain-containing protein [Halomonas qijiaojingensis]GGY10352.1 SAM-dependent methyltransferase [Halomonas qijiaojingensis]